MLLLLLSTACANKLNDDNSKLLAKVHDSYLYISDIQDIIPDNITPRDSIAFVKSYVNDWVKTKVMIFQAEQNLPKNQLDFNKQLEDYRNSLIIYRYETELINQSLDTVVTNDDIETYYNSHLNDFELKENITRAVYAIIDNDSATKLKFDYIFSLNDSLLFDSLQHYSDLAISSYLDTIKWISFINISQVIPI